MYSDANYFQTIRYRQARFAANRINTNEMLYQRNGSQFNDMNEFYPFNDSRFLIDNNCIRVRRYYAFSVFRLPKRVLTRVPIVNVKR